MTIEGAERCGVRGILPALACLLVCWVRVDKPLGTPRTMALVLDTAPGGSAVVGVRDVVVLAGVSAHPV